MTHNITHIPLDDDSSLRFCTVYCSWWLYRGSNLARELDKYETQLVNAAIAAAQKGKHE
jgi:hypothetical protein